MNKSTSRKIAIVLSSLAVLISVVGIDTACARDGGFPYERSGLEATSSYETLTPASLTTHLLEQRTPADYAAHRQISALRVSTHWQRACRTCAALSPHPFRSDTNQCTSVVSPLLFHHRTRLVPLLMWC
jgi:hypothetical protein